MTLNYSFKKIIPTLLIIAILATGIFSVFGVGVAEAAPLNDADLIDIINEKTSYFDTEKAEDESEEQYRNRLEKQYRAVLEAYHGIYDRDDQDAIIGGTVTLSSIISSYKKNNTGICSWYWWSLKGCMNWAASVVGELILSFFGLFVGMSGVILNLVIDYTVVNMGENVGKLGALEEGWTKFRDLANILIIFTLLFIGIATILRIEKYGAKQLLARLIIVALLINFSLFFTGVIIDAGNILSVQFYNEIKPPDSKTGWGMADKYKEALDLQTVYAYKNDSFGFVKIFLISLLGSVLFLVTAFTFLAAAFLLVVRYVVLVFLMILSPLAFVGLVLTGFSGHAGKWWNALLKYSFFAPIYFLLMWIVLEIISSPIFRKSIGLKTGDSYSDVVGKSYKPEGDIPASIEFLPIFLNFGIVIALTIAALVIAWRMADDGSAIAMKIANRARKWGQGVVGRGTFGAGGVAMRNTLGRGASIWASSEAVKERASRKGVVGVVGRMQLRGLRGVAGSSFDARATGAGKIIPGGLGKAGGKGGYEAKLKEQIKKREKFAESLGKVTKTSEDREEEQRIRTSISVAEQAMPNAQEILTRAKAKAKAQPTQASLLQVKQAESILERAEKRKKDGEAELKLIADRIKRQGIERQQQYAQTLGTEKVAERLFMKVPRKNTEAAEKIRGNIKNVKEKRILDIIAREMKKSAGGESKEEEEKTEDKAE